MTNTLTTKHTHTQIPYEKLVWILDKNEKKLLSINTAISLTKMEYEIIERLTKTPNIPIRTDLIIEHLKKKPEKYKGLFMSLSRLQKKFDFFSNGDRLFTAVRNRGYCLTQRVILHANRSIPTGTCIKKLCPLSPAPHRSATLPCPYAYNIIPTITITS